MTKAKDTRSKHYLLMLNSLISYIAEHGEWDYLFPEIMKS